MVIHIEQIVRKTKTRYTVAKIPYRKYLEERFHKFESQERQALNDNKISNYKETLPIELGKRALEMLKDPYIFDIAYSENALEKDVENALVSNITNLLLEFR